MKIIFLDVDGVLNSTRKNIEGYNLTRRPHSGLNYPFDEICMKNLKHIVDETNSYIVLTSLWRKFEDHKNRLMEELQKYNLNSKVIGETCVLDNRVTEIKDYLNRAKQKINYIIIDDSNNLQELADYLIQTDPYWGLKKENAEDAIKLLRKLS